MCVGGQDWCGRTLPVLVRGTVLNASGVCCCQDRAQQASTRGYGVAYNPSDPVHSAVLANVQVVKVCAHYNVTTLGHRIRALCDCL